MRFGILLLASSGCTYASWLRWSVNREVVWAAQETSHATKSEQVGWTPIPTPAPGVRKDGEVVLDLLRRRSTTDWTNPETCGWFSGISSSAVMCGNDFTCATNSDHVVACASGTVSPFFTACLDFSAFKAGSCLSLDSATGCCQQETEPACGTYIWTGSPERYMYKCFESKSIISILDVPQFVIDASIFSKTHTTPTPTITPSSSATGNSPSSGNTGGSAPESGVPESGATTTASPAPTTNNTPIIVGSVVGGIAGLLLLLLLLLFCLRRKTKGKLGLGFTRNKKSKKEDNSSKTYHTTNVNAGKGRHSSASEATTAVPGPQPQHYYHHQEQHHYHPQGQMQPPQQPQHQGAAGGQPISMSYTVNEGPTHTRQPSYSQPAAPSMPNAPPQFVVGGIVPISHSKEQQQQQPHSQPQQYPQQQVPPQLQPVNHIHVYYAPPMHQPEAQARGGDGGVGGGMPDASGLVAPNPSAGGQNHSRSQSQPGGGLGHADDYGHDNQGYRYGHNRGMSGVSSTSRNRSPSTDLDAEWSGARGPGYRQSF
ncbi:hypothetical protein F5Y19DRAFT_429393 [Xylariaceae sp. FL1651]|nr:hypothetical protein F5Y19DRAFT_429393 [Xylariaceae sp. FL1651]